MSSSSSRWSTRPFSSASTSNSSWNNGTRSNRDEQISSTGFSKARAGHLRIASPDPMTLLQSPSRGLSTADDESSLMAPAIQEKFRRHIQVKLNVLEQRLGIKLAERDPVIAKRRKEELSIIILDFRKLREGIRSIRRIDEFAAEVYETSARYAIHASNYQQLGSCLPHLIFDIYPALYPTPQSLELALCALSILPPSSPTVAPLRITKEVEVRMNYFKQIYLIYLLVYLEEITSFKSIFSSLTSSSTLDEGGGDSFELVIGLYESIRSINYIAFQRIFFPPSSPSTPSPSPSKTTSDLTELALKLARLAIPKMRSSTLSVLVKAYKPTFPTSDLAWLGKILLFDTEAETKQFLIKSGVSVVS